MTQTIAFVGLGAMGSAMAETLVKKQMRVVGYDVSDQEAITRRWRIRADAARSSPQYRGQGCRRARAHGGQCGMRPRTRCSPKARLRR